MVSRLFRMLQKSLALLVPLLAIATADKSYHGYKVTLSAANYRAANDP